jgi:predicted N-acyltransferase
LVLAAAFDGDQFLAGSLWIIDGTTLCLRTWSAHREIPGLVMELICHRPIEFAIVRQLACVDSGLLGAHKRERGYADRTVFSAHCFRDDGLRDLAMQTLKDLGQYPWPEPDLS